VVVIATEFTLAAARDTIRILAWLKSNAPQTTVVVVANKVQPAALQEISRKDFEGSIERRVDFVIPYEPKTAAQAAKLGKPLAEAGKSVKTLAPLGELATSLMTIADSTDTDAPAKDRKDGAKGGSLIGKLTSKLPRKGMKAKK